MYPYPDDPQAYDPQNPYVSRHQLQTAGGGGELGGESPSRSSVEGPPVRDIKWEGIIKPVSSGGGGGTYGIPAGSSSITPFQQQLRSILLEQLGLMGKAPTVNDPGIAENLAGRRLALQRSSERQRGSLAEALANSGLAFSGAADTGRLGIEQARGEAEAQGVGQVLGSELQQRRQQLSALLAMALQTGDAEAARIIQQQMHDDDLAYQYNALQQQGNLAALMQILNAA